MKENKEIFSDDYVVDVGTGTGLPESNEGAMAGSDIVTSAIEEDYTTCLVEGTTGSSKEESQGATSDYYVAKPKRTNIRARIIDD